MALRRSAVRIRYAPCKKAPISGAFLHGAILGLLPLPRCGKYAMGSHAAAQAKLPTAVRQLGQTRSVCPAGASRRGVADGAAASQQAVAYPGRLTHPADLLLPNQKTIWFGFCFPFIFNTHACVGIACLQALPPPRRTQNGPKRPKSLSMPKPVFLSANSC